MNYVAVRDARQGYRPVQTLPHSYCFCARVVYMYIINTMPNDTPCALKSFQVLGSGFGFEFMTSVGPTWKI